MFVIEVKSIRASDPQVVARGEKEVMSALFPLLVMEFSYEWVILWDPKWNAAAEWYADEVPNARV